MKRYAIVRRRDIDPDVVAQYLPSNYKVIWHGKTDWHWHQIGGWKQAPGLVDDVVVIQGTDDHGWTLHGYVIPRLGSGMMRADECGLDHPIMKEIPCG